VEDYGMALSVQRKFSLSIPKGEDQITRATKEDAMKSNYLYLGALFIMLIVLPITTAAGPEAGRTFIVHLSGSQAVMPIETRAQGQTTLHLHEDGASISYKLIVSNITDVMMAHIHLGAAGINGPVVAWLYPAAPPPVLIQGRSNGVLAEGTITAENLVGPLAGQPLSALLGKMRAGEAYVNVHTNRHPAGEIRGQILWPVAGAKGKKMSAFTGGDYWVMHLNAARNLLRNPDGTFRNPATYTDADWAEVRRLTGYYLGWGYQARLSPPDTGGSGTMTIVDGMEHRHRVDQNFCSDCGIIPGTPPTALTYTISADNRLTITEADPADPSRTRTSWWGALSRDFNVMTAAPMEGFEAGQNLIMGVKVAAAAQILSGLHAVNGYGVDFSYPVDSSTTPPSVGPVASHLGIGAGPGWIDLVPVPAGLEFSSHTNIIDPALATAFANAAAYSNENAPISGPITVPFGGVYSDTSGSGIQLALSPDNEVAIVASGTNDIDPRFTDTFNERHHASYGILLKQAPDGTFNRARIAGTYFGVSRWDDIHIGSPGPLPDCHAGPDALPGSVSCGTRISQRAGTGFGEITFTSSGVLTYRFTEVNDFGEMTIDTDTAAYTVETQCFGIVGGLRLDYSDPACAGGRLLDVIVARRAMGEEFAKIFIGDGGDVLTFFDPRSIDVPSDIVGRSRSFGIAVRSR